MQLLNIIFILLIRDRRKMQTSNIGFWESWRRSQSINIKRVWGQIGGTLSGLLPWQHTLHAIEGKKILRNSKKTYFVDLLHHENSNPHLSDPGRFGVGVKAYFVFLRYLVYLNLLHCALIGGFIVGPTAFYGRSNSTGEWLQCHKSKIPKCTDAETLLCCI